MTGKSSVGSRPWGSARKKATIGFTDAAPGTGDPLYYRLRQVDFDGSFDYSPIVAVSLPASDRTYAVPQPHHPYGVLGGQPPLPRLPYYRRDGAHRAHRHPGGGGVAPYRPSPQPTRRDSTFYPSTGARPGAFGSSADQRLPISSRILRWEYSSQWPFMGANSMTASDTGAVVVLR